MVGPAPIGAVALLIAAAFATIEFREFYDTTAIAAACAA